MSGKAIAARELAAIEQKAQRMTAELDAAHEKLKDIPNKVRFELLAKQEDALEAVLQQLKKLHDENLRLEEQQLHEAAAEGLRQKAAPLVRTTNELLQQARESLTALAGINSELAQLGAPPAVTELRVDLIPHLELRRPGLYEQRF